MNKLKKIILNNGISLYLYVDPSMKRTFVSYNINYGSSGKWFSFNNNGKDYNVITGYAHYLEHLLGEHSKYGNMYRNFDRRYQRANAYTGMNQTSYHFNGKDNIETSLEELITSIDTPVFDQKDVDATRHAIEEESASNIDNTSNNLHGLLGRNLFGGFELYDKTLSPIGNRETTKQITLEGLYDCYNAFYTNDNKYIIIGGNVDENKIVDLLNNIYSKLTPYKTNLILPDLDFDSIRCRSEIINGDLDIPKVGLGIKFKKSDTVLLKELYFTLLLIRKSLLNSDEMRDLENNIYDVLDFCYIPNVNDYIYYSFGFVSKNKDELISNLLELLSKRVITQKEYEINKKAIIASKLRSMEKKYNSLKSIPMGISISDGYSDCDFYQSIDYDRFMEIVSTLDYSNYTVGEVKRLNK